MIRGLVEKELRQNGTVLLFLLLLMMSGLVLVLRNDLLARAGGSPLEAARYLTLTFIPLGSLLLGHVLVASEFRQKTQLFLEGLPLPRWRMLAVKYLFGVVIIVVGAMAVLGGAWWKAGGGSGLTPQAAGIQAAKLFGWAWCIYSLCFAHAFLGRYRTVFAIVVVIALAFAQHRGVPVETFGPFGLMDARFAYERYIWPWQALEVTAGLTVGFIALGFIMGLVRDATLAGMLAERMSSREKLFLSVLCFGGMGVLTLHDSSQRNAEPLLLPGSMESVQGAARVSASAAVDKPSAKEVAALDLCARRTAEDLAAVAAYLHCPALPPVFIVHRRDLAANDFVNGDLPKEQGLMVRLNLIDKRFDQNSLQRWLLRELLLVKSFDRLSSDANGWVLDGFCNWWPRRGRNPDPSSLVSSNGPPWQSWQGLDPGSLDETHLRRWLAVRRDNGPDYAAGLAAALLQFLARTQGEDARQHFLADVLGRDIPHDARAWFQEQLHPVPALFQRDTGLGLPAFLQQWRSAWHPPALLERRDDG